MGSSFVVANHRGPLFENGQDKLFGFERKCSTFRIAELRFSIPLIGFGVKDYFMII